jgi:hypothetical protein
VLACYSPQLEGLFLSSLLLQIQKVNAFYIDKAQELGEHLERISPIINPNSRGLAAALRTLGSGSTNFAKASPAEVLNCLMQSAQVPQETRQALALFRHLAEEVDMLRRYALLNFLGVTKVVKKHDKLSHLTLKGPLSIFVATQPFHSGVRLLNTFSSMRAFASDLVATARGGPPHQHAQQCPRCAKPLRMGFVYDGRLRLCNSCFASAAEHTGDLAGYDVRFFEIDGLLEAPIENEQQQAFALWPPVDPGAAGAAVTTIQQPTGMLVASTHPPNGCCNPQAMSMPMDQSMATLGMSANECAQALSQINAPSAVNTQVMGPTGSNGGGGSLAADATTQMLALNPQQQQQQVMAAAPAAAGFNPMPPLMVQQSSGCAPSIPPSLPSVSSAATAPTPNSPLSSTLFAMQTGQHDNSGLITSSAMAPAPAHAPMASNAANLWNQQAFVQAGNGMPGGGGMAGGPPAMISLNGMPTNPALGMGPQLVTAGNAMGAAFSGGAVVNAAAAAANAAGGLDPNANADKTKKWACQECHKAKTACEGGNPCRRCQRLGKTCIAQDRPMRRRRGGDGQSAVIGADMQQFADPAAAAMCNAAGIMSQAQAACAAAQRQAGMSQQFAMAGMGCGPANMNMNMTMNGQPYGQSMAQACGQPLPMPQLVPNSVAAGTPMVCAAPFNVQQPGAEPQKVVDPSQFGGANGMSMPFGP